jgi:gag-polypeptide of LTR copia-type
MRLKIKDEDDAQSYIKRMQNLKQELEEQGMKVLADLYIIVPLGSISSAYAISISIPERQEDITPMTIIN